MHQKLIIVPYNLAVLFSLFLINYEIIIFLSSDAYLPALPEIAREYLASHQMVYLTITMWFLGAATLQLFLGPFTEWAGRRPVLLTGGLIFTMATIGCALCQNIYTLLILRFIQGAAIPSVTVAGEATIHEIFDRTQAIHMLAVMCGWVVLAPAFGPLLGAVILYYANWRGIFLLLALWASLAVVGMYFYMPETIENKYKKINLRGCLRQYKDILSNDKYVLLLLTSRCLLGAMLAWVYSSPFLLMEEFGLTAFNYAIIQALVFGSFALSARLLKILMDKVELKVIVLIGVSLAVTSSLCTIILSYFPKNVEGLTVCMMLMTAGAGIAFPILSRLTVESSNENTGQKVAMSAFITSLFGIASSGIISRIFDNSLFSLGLILTLFCVLACGLLVKRTSYLLCDLNTDT